MGRSIGEGNSSNCGSAPPTWIAFSSIGVKRDFEISALAIHVDIEIIKTGSTPRDCAFHNSFYRIKNCSDLRFAQPRLPEYRPRILALPPRHQADRGRCLAQAHRRLDHRDLAFGRMRVLPEELPPDHVRVLCEVLQAADRGVGDLRGIEQLHPLGGGALRRDRLDHGVEADDVHRAGVGGGVARVLEDLGLAHDLEEALPVPVGVGQDRHVAVARAERLAGARQHARVADVAVVVEGALPQMLDHQPGGHGLEHRHLHALALAGALPVHQRRQGREGKREAHRLVGDDGRRIARHVVPRRAAHQVGEAGARHDRVVIGRQVAIGAVGREAVAADIDDVGLHLRDRLVAEAQPLDRRGPHRDRPPRRGVHPTVLHRRQGLQSVPGVPQPHRGGSRRETGPHRSDRAGGSGRRGCFHAASG